MNLNSKNKLKVAIVNYGMGNLLSVKRAFDYCGSYSVITNKEKEIYNSDLIILPGVGSFKKAMENLKNLKLHITIKEASIKKKIILGICLGAQLLMTESEEHGSTQGLDLIEGYVKKINTNKAKIPNIGWREINFINDHIKPNSFFEKVKKKDVFYFIHSYKIILKEKKYLLAQSKYDNLKISSIIKKDNVIGFQFHPEKSSLSGLNLIKNLLKSI